MRFKIDGVSFSHKETDGNFVLLSPSWGKLATFETLEEAQKSRPWKILTKPHLLHYNHIVQDAKIYQKSNAGFELVG